MTIGYTKCTYHSGAHFASLWDGLEDFGAYGEMGDSAGIHQTSGHTAGLRIRIVARLVDDDLMNEEQIETFTASLSYLPQIHSVGAS